MVLGDREKITPLFPKSLASHTQPTQKGFTCRAGGWEEKRKLKMGGWGYERASLLLFTLRPYYCAFGGILKDYTHLIKFSPYLIGFLPLLFFP